VRSAGAAGGRRRGGACCSGCPGQGPGGAPPIRHQPTAAGGPTFSASGTGSVPASCATSVGTCGGGEPRGRRLWARAAPLPWNPFRCCCRGPSNKLATPPKPPARAHPAVLDQVLEVDGRREARVHAERVPRGHDLRGGAGARAAVARRGTRAARCRARATGAASRRECTHLEHGDAIAGLLRDRFELLLGCLDHLLRREGAYGGAKVTANGSQNPDIPALAVDRGVRSPAPATDRVLTLSFATVRAKTSASC
jgi:hypothetical protein